MYEPMHEEDIKAIIDQVDPNFDNGNFVRIEEDQMPDILQFIDENKEEFQFEDWTFVGRGEDDEPAPGSAAEDERPSKNLFQGVDGLVAGDEEESVDDEEEQEEIQQETGENENSVVYSLFLSNWEEQMRQIRDAKKLEWEKRREELLEKGKGERSDEAETEKGVAADEFVDEEGDSWLLIPRKPSSCLTDTNDLQVALRNLDANAVVDRASFFENWPSFHVKSKLGVFSFLFSLFH